MSISSSNLSGVRTFVARIVVECRQLGEDVAVLWRSCVAQWRGDPQFRRVVLSEFFQGLAMAARRGPRATLFWIVVFVCQVLLRAMEILGDGDDPVFA
ncbi:hypothetical protein [Cellulomonas sp. Leaf395]|uniref:hypothetical protein n=1 Tax=Cellulomonas sp. Leaf395 TaxID=1736362 RepID=UPI000AF92A57|nr:hypothetical protein [Cellulomonas sp. Leaf395]